MDRLVLYDDYTRQQVHRIFDPSSSFTRGSGTWGGRGIVRVRDTEDYVFFVTFGRQQAHHTFEEWVTEEGILMWQSEPGQALQHPRIQRFINHDHRLSHIYLFLRPDRYADYTYLGRLAYLMHDNERERPVYFRWQILEWNPPNPIREMLNLTGIQVQSPPDLRPGVLPSVTPTLSRKGQTTSEFVSITSDHLVEPERAPQVSLAGEHLVVCYEMQVRTQDVQHVSSTYGSHLGYHVLSQDENHRRKFIKVETTRGGNATPFRMTEQELRFGSAHADQYAIYRVYGYRSATNSGMFYELRGDPRRHLECAPAVFQALPRF